jgi:hypothetical protein
LVPILASIRHGVGLFLIIFRITLSGSIFSECWRLEFQHYESSLSVDFKSSVRVSFRVLFSFNFRYFKAITTGEEFRKGMKLLVARASNILITTSGGYTQIPR